MKTVSKKRIIGSFGNITKSEYGKILFDNIKKELMRHYFSKQFLEKENMIKDLVEENNRINNENKELSHNNELLKQDNAEKSKKIKSLYWILNNKTNYFKKYHKK